MTLYVSQTENNMLRLMTLLLVLGCIQPGNAQCGDFRLASYYASHMVLQKAPVSAAIWGYAVNEGDIVTVDFDGEQQDVTAYIGEEGVAVWTVSLSPTTAGGPYDLSFTSDGCTIDMEDVLFGDVYFCAGQSNMEFRFNQLDDFEDDLDDVVNYPNVRTFYGSHVASDIPLYDVDPSSIARNWEVPTPENMASYSAICWFFGRNLNIELNYPIGLVENSWGGTRIETWSSPEAVYECFGDEGPPFEPDHNEPSQLWNAMVHPYLPMSIYGAIWYQGENNRERPDDYICSLPAMINDWRVRWNDQTGGETDPLFTFGQVQLAPDRDLDVEGSFPNTRWAQTTYLGYTPNENLVRVYTAVAADLPDYDSPSGTIHPRYKRQISHRLSLGAFYMAYGLGGSTGRFQGPFPTNIYQQGDQVVIEYDNLLTELDELRTTSGFDLCCSPTGDLCPDGDGGASWEVAEITATDFSRVMVDDVCPGGQAIAGVRYIWRESPCDLEACAVYSVENDLPAPQFVYNGLLAQK